MARRSFSDSSRGDERLIRQLPQLLRQHRPDLMVGESLYRSPAGFTSWSAHWAWSSSASTRSWLSFMPRSL
jgi:hypothetical protein